MSLQEIDEIGKLRLAQELLSSGPAVQAIREAAETVETSVLAAKPDHGLLDAGWIADRTLKVVLHSKSAGSAVA